MVGWRTSVQRPPPPPHWHQQDRSLYRRKGLHEGTAQSTLAVIFRLVVSGLTSTILVVLGTVNLQFQRPFIPISLRLVLGIVEA